MDDFGDYNDFQDSSTFLDELEGDGEESVESSPKSFQRDSPSEQPGCHGAGIHVVSIQGAGL